MGLERTFHFITHKKNRSPRLFEGGKMRRENYITIQGWMVKELGLSGNELLCYALIYGFSQNEDSVFSGSCKYISEWLNVSRQTTVAVLKKLCEKGLICKVEKTINNIIFYDYKVCKDSLQGVKNFDRGCQNSLQGCQKTLHHIYINNNKDNNTPLLYSPPRVEKKPDEKDKYRDVFEEFWKVYPKQRAGNKDKALTTYIRVLKEGRASVEKLLSSVKAYANSEEVKNGYAKGCQAWLNDDRFNVNYSAEQQSYLEDIFK